MPRTIRLLVTVDLDDDDHRGTEEIRDDIERQLAGDLADVVLIAHTDDDGVPPRQTRRSGNARTARPRT